MIPIPLAGLTGLFEGGQFWQTLSSGLAAAAVWCQHRAQPDRDPIAELTFRLRHPVQDACWHPLDTLKRKADRRRV